MTMTTTKMKTRCYDDGDDDDDDDAVGYKLDN